MRRCFVIILLLAAPVIAAAQDEQEKPTVEAAVQAVTDDDGGRAFIVNSKLKSLTELRRMPGAVIGRPQQYSIFLGSDWTGAQLRARETKLANLLSSIGNQKDANKLGSVGIDDFFGATFSREVPTTFADGDQISDLQVRSVLEDLVNSGSLPAADASTIYVIYLEPGLVSTLGTRIGRKHYLSYHNFYYVAGQRLHYVVVPYDSDLETAKAIALRGLVAAVLNPTGEVGN
jgi:hypothetical protein